VLKLVLLVASISAFVIACSDYDASKRCVRNGYEYGCHEPTFSDHFRLSLDLPVLREDFEDELDRRRLYYVISSDYSATDLARLKLTSDNIVSSLVIIDKSGAQHQRAEKFRAYINDKGEVVLISNEFGYYPS